MHKLFAVVLLVVMVILPMASAGAFPDGYQVSIDENWCFLPDGEGAAWLVGSPRAAFHYEKPSVLVVSCSGALPRSAFIPRHTTKLEYGITGKTCAVEIKGAFLSTVQYGALVYPKGWSEITCRFDLGAQEP